MRKILLLGTGVMIFLFVNISIAKKELVIKNGRTVLLQLAPRDPRSLIQGDYMVLRYSIAQKISKRELQHRGKIVIDLDEKNIARFKRIYKDKPLADNEILLSYENRNGVFLGAESFFFQEGHADLYSEAGYGMLKVDKSGTGILIGLCNKDLSLIKPDDGI